MNKCLIYQENPENRHFYTTLDTLLNVSIETDEFGHILKCKDHRLGVKKTICSNCGTQRSNTKISDLVLGSKNCFMAEQEAAQLLTGARNRPQLHYIFLECSSKILICTVKCDTKNKKPSFIFSFYEEEESEYQQAAKELHKQEMKALEEDINQLVYIISHKLKGPTTSISSLLNIYNTEEDKTEKNQILDMLKESTTNLKETLEKSIHWLNERHGNKETAKKENN